MEQKFHLVHEKKIRVEQKFHLVHEKKDQGGKKNFKIVKRPCSLNRYYRVVFVQSSEMENTCYDFLRLAHALLLGKMNCPQTTEANVTKTRQVNFMT